MIADRIPVSGTPEDMLRGLKNLESSLPMIPTYLSDAGQIPMGQPVAVIDAGGTNLRFALLEDGKVLKEDRMFMFGIAYWYVNRSKAKG